MKEIKLTRGQVAMVDDDVYPMLAEHKWYAQPIRGGKFMAARNDMRTGRKKMVYMHQMVAGTQEGQETHHWSENTLDNRRENVVALTPHEHRALHKAIMGPRRVQSNTGLRGVHQDERNGHFLASIWKVNRPHYLGSYQTSEEAAMAYNRAALDYFGPTARLNPIPSPADVANAARLDVLASYDPDAYRERQLESAERIADLDPRNVVLPFVSGIDPDETPF